MIDQKTQQQLRERFNPCGSQLRLQQLRLFEMLKYIDTICKNNNITYWLSSGTCLGAVRHGGFIPWDDDLDVEMLWKDYKRFIVAVKKDKSKKFIVQTAKNDPYYFYPYGKLRDLNSEISEVHELDKKYKYKGIFVDVFVIEPSGSRFLHSKVSAVLRKCSTLSIKGSMPIWFTKGVVYDLIYIPLLYINRFVLSIFKPKRHRHILGHSCNKIRYLNEIFPLQNSTFEGEDFPIPYNSGAYLSRFYGNYMSLPQLGEIHPHSKSENLKIRIN